MFFPKLAWGLLGCAVHPVAGPPASHLPISELSWTPLNPARGDASPRAATLWGDRTGPGPSGFLVRFVDGFSSPPHIHNVSYRAVVIDGEVHNDDPGAANLWMEPGSFWTQPRGEVHVTSSSGISVAYVEIDDGPYLVASPAEARDFGEKPVNVDASNLVWSATTVEGAERALLWGRPGAGPGGTMFRLIPGTRAELTSDNAMRAVVVAGSLRHSSGRSSPAGSLHTGPSIPLHCHSDDACVVYLRSEGALGLRPAE